MKKELDKILLAEVCGRIKVKVNMPEDLEKKLQAKADRANKKKKVQFRTYGTIVNQEKDKKAVDKKPAFINKTKEIEARDKFLEQFEAEKEKEQENEGNKTDAKTEE